MRRKIKFRAWDKDNKRMTAEPEMLHGVYEGGWFIDFCGDVWERHGGMGGDFIPDNVVLMQYTGLTDKNEKKTCIYEDDIISLSGIIIGNKYENADLLKDPVNLLIEGFGTKAWLTTYTKAMERGCTDSE